MKYYILLLLALPLAGASCPTSGSHVAEPGSPQYIDTTKPQVNKDLNEDLAMKIVSQDVTAVEQLLAEGADPNGESSLFETSNMDLAIRHWNKAIVTAMIKHGGDVYKPCGRYHNKPFDSIAHNKKKQDFLASLGVKISEEEVRPPADGDRFEPKPETKPPCLDDNNTCLSRFVILGNIENVRYYLRRGANPNTPLAENSGSTAVGLAVRFMDRTDEGMPVLDLLLLHGGNLNAHYADGKSTPMDELDFKPMDAVLKLVEKGGRITSGLANAQWNAALLNGHWNFALMLIPHVSKHYLDVKVAGTFVPLAFAIANFEVPLAKALINAGADVHGEIRGIPLAEFAYWLSVSPEYTAVQRQAAKQIYDMLHAKGASYSPGTSSGGGTGSGAGSAGSKKESFAETLHKEALKKFIDAYDGLVAMAKHSTKGSVKEHLSGLEKAFQTLKPKIQKYPKSFTSQDGKDFLSIAGKLRRALSMELHPDRGGNEEQFKKMENDYAALVNFLE